MYVARSLGAASYGVIGFALAVYLYLVRVADCGLEAGLGVREIALHTDRVATAVPSLIVARFLVSLVLTSILIVIALALLPEPDGSVLAVWALCLLAVGTNTRWIHLGMEQTRFASLARGSGELLMAILVFILVHDSSDVARVPLAQFAGDVLASLMLALWLRRRGVNLALHLNFTAIAPYVSRSLPLIWSGLLGLVIYNSDLIFLRVFRGTAEVGFYAAAYALISFLSNLGAAYNHSLLPRLTSLQRDRKEEQTLYDTASAQVFAVTVPTAVGGAMLAPHIIDGIFGSAYAASGDALRILMWSVPLLLVRGVPGVALMARAREKLFFRIHLWATVVNLSLNIGLIPRYGLVGAAWATVVTEAVRLVLAHVFARDVGFRLTGIARYWRSTVAALGMAGVLYGAAAMPVYLTIPLGALAYGLGLALLGGIRMHGRLPVLNV